MNPIASERVKAAPANSPATCPSGRELFLMETQRRRCPVRQNPCAAGSLVFKVFPGSPISGMAALALRICLVMALLEDQL